MKPLSLSLMLSVLIIFTFACSDQGSNTQTPPTMQSTEPESASPSRGTLGLSVLTITNPFFKTIADNFEAECKKHGYQSIVVSGDMDVNKQAAQVEDFIVKNVASIVLVPCDPNAIGPSIKKANDAGIPVFTIDTGYDGSEGKVISHIATDNFQGGKLAGEAMVKVLGETGGKVGIIHFPQTRSCILRVKGFKEIIDAHNKTGKGKIEIVAELNGGGIRDQGFKVTKDMLEANPDVAGIFAINDLSALGGYAAVEAAGKTDQIKIIGFDGQKVGKQAILEGKLLCDPIQFPDRMGRKAVEFTMKHLSGEALPEEYLMPAELYYKADAEKDPELKGE